MCIYTYVYLYISMCHIGSTADLKRATEEGFGLRGISVMLPLQLCRAHQPPRLRNRNPRRFSHLRIQVYLVIYDPG